MTLGVPRSRTLGGPHPIWARLVCHHPELTYRPSGSGMVSVAYSGEPALIETLGYIPLFFKTRIADIIICDDASADATFDPGQLGSRRCRDPPVRNLTHEGPRLRQ